MIRSIGVLQISILVLTGLAATATGADLHRPARLGSRGSIVATRPGAAITAGVTASGNLFPQPRLVGFSPLIAISATNEHSTKDIDYAHELQPAYLCDPDNPPTMETCGTLNAPAATNFVVGILDSGAVVDLVAGLAADRLGIFGPYMTTNSIPIGGVGGEVSALISHPIGYYAAGLSAVGEGGLLDTSQLVGHTNVSVVAAPAIDCGGGETIIAVIGTPFLAFYTSFMYVDTPRRVIVEDLIYKSPDVQIQSPLFGIPDEFAHSIPIVFGGPSPAVTTASYYPVVFDPEDLTTPMLPTQLSFTPVSLPFGGVFFTDVLLREGPAGNNNPVQAFRMMVDTGAQSSIISPAVAASLSLPRHPDFEIDVCGVGGVSPAEPAYYVDYVKLNALGGALEFSNAPFVVLDLMSPEGGSLDGVLGMNFFWNRNVAFEPSITTSGFVHVSAPIPVAPADLDVDQQVNNDDHFAFVNCFSGPGAAIAPECLHADLTGEGRVSLDDFMWMTRCYNDPEVDADLECGP